MAKTRVGLLISWLSATAVSVLLVSQALAIVQQRIGDPQLPLPPTASEGAASAIPIPSSAEGPASQPPSRSELPGAGESQVSIGEDGVLEVVPTVPGVTTSDTSAGATTGSEAQNPPPAESTTGSIAGAGAPTTAPGAASAAPGAPAGPTTTTTEPDPSTTLVTGTAAAEGVTFQVTGGVVLLRCSGEDIIYAATPSFGFTAEAEEKGNSGVDVIFERDGKKTGVKARCRIGELEVKFDE